MREGEERHGEGLQTGNESAVTGFQYVPGMDPYADIPDQEVIWVRNVPWVFQHISGTEQKRIQSQCRRPRSGELDQVRFFTRLCDAVVLGIAQTDEQGQPTDPPMPVPGTRFNPSSAKDTVSNAMEEALMTFLFD